MSEFDLIQRYFQRPFSQGLNADRGMVTLGIGDDCALLQMPPNHELAISMDTLVEKVHFLENTDAFLLAQRALRVCVSDLAAMGASAVGFTLGLTLPKLDNQWLDDFSRGLYLAAQQLKIPLVGGDTTKGPLTITLQVHGAVPSGQGLRRSHAQMGDDIYVNGSLGDGAAALSLLQKTSETDCPKTFDYFKQRFYCPDVAMQFASQARPYINSAIDVSDGLLADLNHILAASQLGADIDISRLPRAQEMGKLIDAQTHQMVDIKTQQQWALTGGDDYRLCFTASPAHVSTLRQLAQKNHTGITRIGSITAGSGITLFDQGKRCSENTLDHSQGYSHF